MRRTYLWPLMILCGTILISLALVADTRSRGQDGDIMVPLAEASDSFVFQLELGGEVVAEYTECFGLGSSNEIKEEVIQTGVAEAVKKTPGPLEWHNITLKRAGVSHEKVWEWREAMAEGKLDEAITDGAIVMRRAGSSEEISRWTFAKGWPGGLTIEGSNEELTIVHGGLHRATHVANVPRRPTK
jgi:phage tail-like protein